MMENYLAHKFAEAEDIVLKQVLGNLLQRDPSLRHIQKVTKLFTEGILYEYELYYKDVLLGKVKYNFFDPETMKYGVEFIPKDL